MPAARSQPARVERGLGGPRPICGERSAFVEPPARGPAPAPGGASRRLVAGAVAVVGARSSLVRAAAGAGGALAPDDAAVRGGEVEVRGASPASPPSRSWRRPPASRAATNIFRARPAAARIGRVEALPRGPAGRRRARAAEPGRDHGRGAPALHARARRAPALDGRGGRGLLGAAPEAVASPMPVISGLDGRRAGRCARRPGAEGARGDRA